MINRDRRSTARRTHALAVENELNPGDQAALGTPGTGENVCPKCAGRGRLTGSACPICGGTGKVIEGIGGA